MSRSNRLSYFAGFLGLLLLISGNWGAVAETHDKVITLEIQDRTGKDQDRPDTATTPATPEHDRQHPAYKKPHCDSPKDAVEADLCEQGRMAQAAEDLVRRTDTQISLSQLEIGALFFALVFTALAAIAAAYQVWLSRHALIKTQRAFVFLKLFQVFPEPDRPIIRIMPEWENTGDTPTEKMASYVNWQYFPNGMPEDFDFPDLPGSEPMTPSLIGPKGSKISSPLDIEKTCADLVIDGKGRLYLWGWTEYDDVFERTPRHRTEFCHEVLVTSVQGESNQLGLQFRMYKKHNGADDQCMKPIQPYPF